MLEQEQSKTLDSQVVPSGYKLTEAGIIPDTWEVKTINDVATFRGGAQPSKEFFSSKPKKGYIRLIQIRDYKSSEYETYIPEILAKKKCTENDIMIGRYGPPIFQILRGIQGAYNVALIKAVPTTMIEREYLYYFLKTNKLFVLMDGLSQRSSGQTGIELPALKSYPVPLPTKLEQTAIANVLSDTDALIIELEKLIAKKQAIKTATMQQLLTARTRLPQFARHSDGTIKVYKTSELGEIPEDWLVVSFKDVLTIKHGKNQKRVESPSGQYPIYATGGRIGNATSYLFDKPSVLIGRKGTIDKPRYADTPFWTVDTLFYSEIKKNASVKFIYYKFCMIDWMQYNEASGVPSLNARTIENVLITLPNLEEQTAIASILSDMDDELKALEQKLAKVRDIQQGMMQQLLTGRIRLPLEQQP